MTQYKQPAADQETLVEQLNTYIYGLEQKLADARVTITDNVHTVKRTRALVGSDTRTKKNLTAMVKRLTRDGTREKQKLGRQIQVLRRAIEVIVENHDVVRPNQFRARVAILECMDLSTKPVSSKQIIEYLSLLGMLMDRRRVSIRLSYMKRDGVVTNPKHGRWTITPAGRKELLDRQKD